jgi:UDP-2,3-diacylglucosamine pyrophosphatase LpxH
MLIFIGDVHGEFYDLTHKLTNHNIRNSTFIQVGDFGVGFKSNKENEIKLLGKLNDRLKADRNVMYVIRGNHDDPAYFDGNVTHSNLIFLKDYSLLEIEGKTILLIGGAISVDRTSRTLNKSYWADEGFVLRDELLRSKINQITKLDIVVTHNAPAEFSPVEFGSIVKSWSARDHELITDLKKERARHTMLFDILVSQKLKPKFWYYGHFHYSFNDNFKGVKYRLLNCSEFFEHQ